MFYNLSLIQDFFKSISRIEYQYSIEYQLVRDRVVLTLLDCPGGWVISTFMSNVTGFNDLTYDNMHYRKL